MVWYSRKICNMTQIKISCDGKPFIAEMYDGSKMVAILSDCGKILNGYIKRKLFEECLEYGIIKRYS
jgi:hypothetical protein